MYSIFRLSVRSYTEILAISLLATLAGVWGGYHTCPRIDIEAEEGALVPPVNQGLFYMNWYRSRKPGETDWRISSEDNFLVLFQAMESYLGGLLVTVWGWRKKWLTPFFACRGYVVGLLFINFIYLPYPIRPPESIPYPFNDNFFIFPAIVFLFTCLGTWIGYVRHIQEPVPPPKAMLE